VAYAAIQSGKALNVHYIQCCVDLATAFRATLCSRWVLHISSGYVGKVTVSYEGGRFFEEGMAHLARRFESLLL